MNELSRLDSAAIFGAALSLWRAAAREEAQNSAVCLSDCYSGMDGLMRQVMRIAMEFETWACEYIAFDGLDDVWPYVLEDRFGDVCIRIVGVEKLARFETADSLRVAWALRLPIQYASKLCLPLEIRAANPTRGAIFVEFCIQTLRDWEDQMRRIPFTKYDALGEEDRGEPYFGLFGILADGASELIASRPTYSAAAELAGKLAPGIDFPDRPIVQRP